MRDFQPAVLRGLLRKGLAYLEVPVEQGDRFAIPPLEVSRSVLWNTRMNGTKGVECALAQMLRSMQGSWPVRR